MNILPKLSLNKHPKDNENLSLVNALNVKISNDESCITNEESILENPTIKNCFTREYNNTNYKIVGIIPCNEELVLIVIKDESCNEADIFRYHEKTTTEDEYIYKAYGNTKKLSYHGGKIKGTFTYNVESSLIVAIAEYDCYTKVPLRTINLGNYKDNTVYNDTNLPDTLLSVSPELKLPNVTNVDYVPGSAYKGWYYLYIRFKINSVDYTQWFNFGYPIYVDTIEQFQIIRYCYNRKTYLNAPEFGDSSNSIIFPDNPPEGYGAGCSDYFSNKKDIAEETFKVTFKLNNINFKKYQIGIVCGSKSYLKAFKTADINFINNTYTDYIFNAKTVDSASTNEFIKDNYNYFNVKNVINYKNRLYISNYLENNLNDKFTEDLTNKIKVKLYKDYIDDDGVVYDQCMIRDNNNANQYDVYKWPRIPLITYLGVNENTKVKIKYISDSLSTKTVEDTADRFFISCFNDGGKESTFGNIVLGYFNKSNTIEWLNTSIALNNDYTINILNDKSIDSIIINKLDYALLSGRQYINTKKAFNKRKLNSTLIPGEIYNFFIHFVDKYGHSTNGYRISNNNKCFTEDDTNNEIIPIKFKVYIDTKEFEIYASQPINNNVLNNSNKINISNIKYYSNYDSSKNMLTDKITDSKILSVAEYDFILTYKYFEDDKFKNTKWYQIVNNSNTDNFDIFINNNGDRLFKIPYDYTFENNVIFDFNNVDIKKTYRKHTIYNVSFSNIEIPKNYIGYFISYEKYEPVQRATGLLTRNDFRSQDIIRNGDLVSIKDTANTRKSNKMLFYSSVYDVYDKIKLDYNIFRVEGVNVFNKEDIPEYDYMQRNNGFNFMHDMNKPQINSIHTNAIYPMPNYKLAVADSIIDDRGGVGTCLQIDDKYNLFPIYKTSEDKYNNIKLYRITLLNTTRNIYMSNNKTLIRLTDVIYNSDNTGVITKGLNGHVTYEGVLIYENNGVIFNEAENKVKRVNYNDEYYKSDVPSETPHTFQNDIPFAMYLQYPIYNDVFFESKSYKNQPKGITYFVKYNKDDANKNQFWNGCMVTPPNSIDLFENRQGSSDDFNIKTYTNYRENLVSVDKFNKTVRRSNVIQDESRSNGWRTFPVEAYKNITENKGNITNLVGAGTLLLVHTEHSLFMFDTNNVLQTKDKDIQLLQPDAFEVNYKEVFTSDLGYGGLQDDKSYIVDQFGYIFYNNDFNRFYRFDNGQLILIDNDIIQWLNKYKPYNVRFANDKFNNRLLIKMNYIVNKERKNITISYNYKTNCFVSLHSYDFEDAYNTKTELYFKCTNNHKGCSLHSFIHDGSSYGKFDNIINKHNTTNNYPSKISIIINNDYETIKFLNYISYILYKYNNGVNKDYTQLPVEEMKRPFSGNTLSVYNHLVNTGNLDISVNTESNKNIFGRYDKPYWELNNWNFSYLRNNVDKLNKGMSAFEMSRIFGNYFVVEFTFNNEDNLKIEFETLNYNVSNER